MLPPGCFINPSPPDDYTTSTKALGELVANALDASATNIRITVDTNALGGIASIRVEDDGRGMTPDDILVVWGAPKGQGPAL